MWELVKKIIGFQEVKLLVTDIRMYETQTWLEFAELSLTKTTNQLPNHIKMVISRRFILLKWTDETIHLYINILLFMEST